MMISTVLRTVCLFFGICSVSRAEVGQQQASIEFSSNGWVKSPGSLEKGDGGLLAKSGPDQANGWVDVVAQPGTLDAALGLEEGTTAVGGANPWTVFPYEEINGSGAGVEVRGGQGDSWLEMPVQGPSAVDFSWKVASGFDFINLRLLVDGVPIRDFAQSQGYSEDSRVEVPAGSHVLRWLAGAAVHSNVGDSSVSIIGNVRTSPLAADTNVMKALSFPQPISFPPGWESSHQTSRDGSPVMRMVNSQNFYDLQTISTSVTGPGELSFWWYAAQPSATEDVASWSCRNATTYEKVDRRYPPGYGSGWKQQKIWLPPGASLLEWTVSGSAAQVGLAALDGIKFTPAPRLLIGPVLDVPEQACENDPEKPWDALKFPGDTGDTILSPALQAGESSRIRSVVRGPGTISFKWADFRSAAIQGEFRVNGVLKNSRNYRNNRSGVKISVPSSSSITLEWTVSAKPGAAPAGFIGVNHVNWLPSPTTSLAGSLDAPASVKWKTSAGIPFTGRSDSKAKGGSSAYIGLMPGEESWLEATVNGPGLFDFSIQKVGGVDIKYDLWNYWSLTVDGVPVAISGMAWPALSITGEGKHRIRFTIKNPDGANAKWIASALDQISWNPLKSTSIGFATGLPDRTWQTGKIQPAVGIADIGRGRVPAILLRPGWHDLSWLGTTVTGPCEISWDSSLDSLGQRGAPVRFLCVDGTEAIPFESHSWQRMRLTLPAGRHDVRWLSKPFASSELQADPPASFSAWLLANMKIKQGVTPLSQALNLGNLFALETGDTGGRTASVGKGSAWQPGRGTSVYVFHPSITGNLSSQWMAGKGSDENQWHYADQDIDGWQLFTKSRDWQPLVAFISPGTFAKWSYSPNSPSGGAPLLGKVVLEGVASKPTQQAIDSPQPVITKGWAGVADTRAVTHQDSLWSVINRPYGYHLASVTLIGPCKVSYWWKVNESGILDLSVDDIYLPVPPAGTAWKKVEFSLNPGTHVVSWTHSTHGEAWLDGLKAVAETPATLASSASVGETFVMTSDTTGIGSSKTVNPWLPVAYREADGSWTHAARAVGTSGDLRVMVKGPGVLTFRGRCLDYGSFRKKSEQANSSGDNIGFEFMGNVLAASIDGGEPLKILALAAGVWTDGTVQVPEGMHEVTFGVRASMGWPGFPSWAYLTEVSDQTAQGWISGLRLVPPADRLANQVKIQNAPPSFTAGNEDTDGDGVENLLEQAFGTNPLDPSSRPPAIEIITVAAHEGFTALYRAVKLPYLSSTVSGNLQSSTDMIHWQNEPMPLLHEPPSEASPEEKEFQYVKIPDDVPAAFYRVRVSDTSPEQ